MVEALAEKTNCSLSNLTLRRVQQASPPDFETERELKSATSSDLVFYPPKAEIQASLRGIVPFCLLEEQDKAQSLEETRTALILEYRSLQLMLNKTEFNKEKFEKLTPEEARKIVDAVFKSIDASSNFFKELEELGYVRELSTHMYVRNSGAFVIDLPKKAHKEPSKAYIFIPEFGLLFTKGAMPKVKDILFNFCVEGKYPRSIRPIIDGSLYASQWKAVRRVVLFGGELAIAAAFEIVAPWIDPFLAVTRISAPFLRRLLRIPFNFILKKIPIFRARHTLGESQKEYFSIESPALYEEHSLDKFDSAAKLLASKKWIHADKDELKKALMLIHQLRVLGVSHTEITGMIPWSKYNRDKKTYPKFESKINSLRKEQGLTDEAVFSEFCRQSRELIEIREKIARTRVMLLSREALENSSSI